jgi:hypothetical protein
VAAGNTSNSSIDGLTYWGKPGCVFKVVSNFDFIFGLTVTNHGIAFKVGAFPMAKELNALLGGGWLLTPPDDGWIPIFEQA